MGKGRALLLFLALMCIVGSARAHTLGIDRAELIETVPGTYRLISRVPRRLAPAIRTPELPNKCTMSGSPHGERGSYSVTFEFVCETPLTADDTLGLPWRREGALLTVRWQGQEPVTRLATRDGAAIDIDLSYWLAGSGSVIRAAERYTRLGDEHILAGIDHLLFVLALLFVVDGRWKLVKTITAFTVAHSITLTLATFGFISLPSAPVEAAIALSIVFLASEIIQSQRGRDSLTFRKPWLVAFAFGLLHGLGFAGALSEIGLPPSEIPVALLFFNIGVEIGQLAFVFAILAVLWILNRRSRGGFDAQTVAPAVAYIVGTLAMFWFIERAGQISGAI